MLTFACSEFSGRVSCDPRELNMVFVWTIAMSSGIMSPLVSPQGPTSPVYHHQGWRAPAPAALIVPRCRQCLQSGWTPHTCHELGVTQPHLWITFCTASIGEVPLLPFQVARPSPPQLCVLPPCMSSEGCATKGHPPGGVKQRDACSFSAGAHI